jgi:hypothetical protein
MDYVVLETEDGEGSGSECNSGGDCRRRAGRTDSSSTRFFYVASRLCQSSR